MYYKCTTKVYITNELLQTESIRNIVTLPQFADYCRSLPIIAEVGCLVISLVYFCPC